MNFFLELGSEEQKKRSSSQITPCGYELFACFRAQFLPGGSRLESGGARLNVMVLISVFVLKCRGEDKEKRSSARNLRLRLGVHSCFRPGSRLYSRLRGRGGGGWHKQFFGGAQAPKCTPVAPGLLLSFEAQYSLTGTFLVWRDTSSDLGGTWPRNAPRGAGPEYNNSSHRRSREGGPGPLPIEMPLMVKM